MPTPIDELTIRVRADTAALEGALERLTGEAGRFSTAITGAFRSAAEGGESFDAILSGLMLKLSTIAFDRAFAPVSGAIGGGLDRLFSAFGLAQGGVVGGGRPKPFARGGVLGGPALFPLGRGLGLAGEAGAEAVLPLARGSDGKLGVRGGGGDRPVTVHVSITTPDADSFRKSEAQVTAMLARAVGRGRRGL